MDGFTQVTIDFQTSHLIFPTVVGGILALLSLTIAVTRWQSLAGVVPYWGRILRDLDKVRFLGALALTVAYFSAMVPVGDIWPNTGIGFLSCSIPFLALSGLLFMHERRRSSLLILMAVSIAAPTFVWWLFGQVFFLTLP
jgi:hypothetical protein